MVQQKAKSRRVRKNLRLPDDLVAWAESFAQRKNKTLTQLVIDCLTDLQERTDA